MWQTWRFHFWKLTILVNHPTSKFVMANWPFWTPGNLLLKYEVDICLFFKKLLHFSKLQRTFFDKTMFIKSYSQTTRRGKKNSELAYDTARFKVTPGKRNFIAHPLKIKCPIGDWVFTSLYEVALGLRQLNIHSRQTGIEEEQKILGDKNSPSKLKFQ